MPVKFRDLKIGQSFDFIGDRFLTSFYLRCTKISKRQYRDEKGIVHKVGTINVEVYHVK